MAEGETRLDRLSPGQSGIVVHIAVEGKGRRRLMEMGLVRGVRVTVVRSAPLGDPIEYELRGYSLSLRRRDAEQITVDAVA